MSELPEIEPVSTEHLLNCLGLAIDEARLLRSLIESKQMAARLRQEQAFSDRLIYLNREISYLEKKLAEVRRQARPGRS
jgi:hypothetical protein